MPDDSMAARGRAGGARTPLARGRRNAVHCGNLTDRFLPPDSMQPPPGFGRLPPLALPVSALDLVTDGSERPLSEVPHHTHVINQVGRT